MDSLDSGSDFAADDIGGDESGLLDFIGGLEGEIWLALKSDSPSFDLLGELGCLPSAGWGDNEAAGLGLRCLFDGMPLADARLLAIVELISRGGAEIDGGFNG